MTAHNHGSVQANEIWQNDTAYMHSNGIVRYDVRPVDLCFPLIYESNVVSEAFVCFCLLNNTTKYICLATLQRYSIMQRASCRLRFVNHMVVFVSLRALQSFNIIQLSSESNTIPLNRLTELCRNRPCTMVSKK